MNQRFSSEVKVGIFVTFGIGLMMLAVLVLGGQSMLTTRKNTFFSHFKNVDGLIQGSKVTIGGVPVGVIESIDFDYAQKDIKLTFSIRKDASQWVRTDSSVEVATQGVLGDKYISINPGSENEPILESGATLPHRPTKDFTQFLSKGDSLMASLNGITASLDRILKTFESDNRSEVFFKGMANTAKNLNLATEKLNQELDQIQFKKAVTQLSSILEKVNNGTGTIGALVNDPGLYDQMKALMGGANRNRIIRNLVRQTIKESEDGSSSTQPNPSPSK
jgi:phospholipid/cholesterol/gamma-HCH transport system substrate-binding protein